MNRMTVLSDCAISRHCARTVITAEITAVFFDDSQTDNVRDEPFIYRPQRSCGQGNVFTGVCLSTGGGRVSASVHAGMPYPPGPGRPPRDHSDTPSDQADPSPGKQTPAYGLRAAGTHPTGMHSCSPTVDGRNPGL